MDLTRFFSKHFINFPGPQLHLLLFRLPV